MKKLIAVLLVCFGIYQANAQITVKPGVRAGLNLSTFTNSDFDRKADFYVGGLVSIKLAKFYTLQPELTYSRQGAKGQTYDINNQNFDPLFQIGYRDYDYEISYMSLGIMNKFSIIDGFHAIVGPTLDFKIDDNFPIYYDDPIDFDLTLNGGIGYTLPMGLTIEARYKMGLIDIFGDYDDDDYYEDDNNNYDDVILNSVFQLGVSYTF